LGACDTLIGHLTYGQVVARGDDQIRRYFIFRAVTSFSMWIPFWTLWAYSNVENLFLLTVVDSAFWITMIAFQVPAGLIGDKYGRKRVLFIGEAIYAVGLLAFGFSTEFWMLVGANAIWAVGVCFIVSGDTPFVYDTLLEHGRAGEFIKISARVWTVQAIMGAAACVVGGILVQFTDPHRLDLTLKISALIGLVGCFTILLVREPKVDREHFVSYTKQLREGMKRVLSSRAILTLIMFQIVIEIAVYVMAVFRSVYMNDPKYLNLDYLQLGLLIGAFTIFGGLAAFQAGRIEGALGEKRSLLFLLLAVIGSFVVVFLIAHPAVILIQFLIYSVSALQSPIINGYINKRVDSPHRSTVVAIATLLFTIILTVVEVGSGWVANEFGLTTSLLVLALGATPVGFLLLILWNREVDLSRAAGNARAKGQT